MRALAGAAAAAAVLKLSGRLADTHIETPAISEAPREWGLRRLRAVWLQAASELV